MCERACMHACVTSSSSESVLSSWPVMCDITFSCSFQCSAVKFIRPSVYNKNPCRKCAIVTALDINRRWQLLNVKDIYVMGGGRSDESVSADKHLCNCS